VVLRVVGELPAGKAADRILAKGEAMRIMTGAMVPEGADAVVRFEESSEVWTKAERPGAGAVAICAQVQPEQNIREAGEDLRAGARALRAGTIIFPEHIGVLATLGCSTVPVVRRPRVAILSTGDELVPVESPLAAGKIRNSNEAALAAMVAEHGGEAVPLGIARDDTVELSAKLDEGLRAEVDLFVSSGGVSTGDFDIVKDVLASEGEIAFWQVAIKPGKPLAFGVLYGNGREVPVLGLPGNPVASMVAFHVFVAPAIRKLGARAPYQAPQHKARLLEPVDNSGRRHYMRAVVRRADDGTLEVSTRGSGVRVQGSGILSSMVWANCFAIVPEGKGHIPAGTDVRIEMFRWKEGVIANG
jgi:molybdopterin molybdotransferase